MNITAKTKILGIFGYPVSHTISPAMHNAVIKAIGLDMAYLSFEVKPSNLKDAINGIKGLGMLGVNITIPHKETVIKFLDEVSEEARLIGAVNTIVNRDGRLIGHNTDGYGYVSSLKEDCNFNPSGKNIVILGAGGAARGILVALAQKGVNKITVANRTVSRGISLIKTFKGKLPGIKFEAIGLKEDVLKISLKDAHLLINATPSGMNYGASRPCRRDNGNTVALVQKIPLDSLPKTAIVSDIVYNPLETILLKNAKRLGLTIHGGLGMLIHQGAKSFKLWTGIDAPIDIMRKAARKALKN